MGVKFVRNVTTSLLIRPSVMFTLDRSAIVSLFPTISSPIFYKYANIKLMECPCFSLTSTTQSHKPCREYIMEIVIFLRIQCNIGISDYVSSPPDCVEFA